MSSTSDKLSIATMVTEIVSGVAVVITLVLLIGQVRANTEAVRLSTQETAMQNANEILQFAVAEPDILQMAATGEPLSSSDSVRARSLATWGLRVVESQFVLHESGQLSEEQRKALRYRNANGLRTLLPWVTQALAECPGCYSAQFRSWLDWILNDPERELPQR